MEYWSIKTELPNYKAQITYDNFIVNLQVKPNLFMILFLKSLGLKVKLFKGDDTNE